MSDLDSVPQPDEVRRAADAIARLDGRAPTVAMVLGSGLGGYADTLAERQVIPYGEIPGFPRSTVSGHSGELVIGTVEGMVVAAMKGRVHLYEGHDAGRVVFPLRVLRARGASHLLITNAAGGINASYRPGDLVVLSDHLNLTGRNPLVGPNDDAVGPRFPDMSTAYTPALRALALEVGAEQGLTLHEGVYAGLLGPTYETPAEIRMLRTLGADTVGMSTVCEVIAARHMGMRILGISCVTNLAAGISATELHHGEVEETAKLARAAFTGLVSGVLGRIAAGEGRA
jgi:purine-nucleoside phosphorylase